MFPLLFSYFPLLDTLTGKCALGKCFFFFVCVGVSVVGKSNACKFINVVSVCIVFAPFDGTRQQDSLLRPRWNQAQTSPLLPRRHLISLTPPPQGTVCECQRLRMRRNPLPQLRWLETCKSYQSTVPLGGDRYGRQVHHRVTPAHHRLRARSGERTIQPHLPCEACVSVMMCFCCNICCQYIGLGIILHACKLL